MMRDPNAPRVIAVPRGAVTYKEGAKVMECAACGKHNTDFIIIDGGPIPGSEARMGVALHYEKGSIIETSVGTLKTEPIGCATDWRDWFNAKMEAGNITDLYQVDIPRMLRVWLREEKHRTLREPT